MHNSKSKCCSDTKPSAYHFYVKTKRSVDFQVCIGVPLNDHDDNVNQMNELTRDHMSKYNKSNYSSNNGNVKNNLQTILKESYGGV